MPNSVTTGTSQTKAGIVCIRSMIGLITALAARLRAAQIPRGIAMRAAITLATKTSASVCIAADHCSMLMISRNPSSEPMAKFQPRTTSPITAKITASTSGGGAKSTTISPSTAPPMTSLKVSKNPLKFVVSQSKKLASQLPIGILGMVTSSGRAVTMRTPFLRPADRSWLGGLAAVPAVWPCAARGPAAT